MSHSIWVINEIQKSYNEQPYLALRFSVPDNGKPQRILLKQQSELSWLLDFMVIKSLKYGYQLFPANLTLSPKFQDMKISPGVRYRQGQIDKLEVYIGNPAIWPEIRIYIQTGDQLFGGTDSDVEIQIIGTKESGNKRTAYWRLRNSETDPRKYLFKAES